MLKILERTCKELLQSCNPKLSIAQEIKPLKKLSVSVALQASRNRRRPREGEEIMS